MSQDDSGGPWILFREKLYFLVDVLGTCTLVIKSSSIVHLLWRAHLMLGPATHSLALHQSYAAHSWRGLLLGSLRGAWRNEYNTQEGDRPTTGQGRVQTGYVEPRL